MNRVLTQWMHEPSTPSPGQESVELEVLDVSAEAANRRRDERWKALGEVVLRWLDEAGNVQSVQVQMVDRSPDGLGVISPCEFSIGDEIWVVFRGEVEHRAFVRHQEKSTVGWHVGLRVISQERRRYERFAVDGAAQLQWAGEKLARRIMPVEVKNVSHQGMQFRSLEQIPLGTAVKIQGVTVQCVGVVWYCRPDGDVFLIGIQTTRDPQNADGLDFRF